jgi:DNA repair protein RecN (Recombination protein N)
VEELIDLKNFINQKISVAVDGEIELQDIKKQLDKSYTEIVAKAQELSKKRAECFSELESHIGAMLLEMGMQHARISFEIQQQDLSVSGTDAISLFFSANKNHPLQDISKTASGGELSRLMLAVKALVSGSRKMPTLILDEIDSGVSGEIADKVGNIIKKMCNGSQVINITHLPQVACKGEAHYLVYKDHTHHTTRTLIKKLNQEERLYEIAKMLSGEQLSGAALENARILLGF